MKRSTRNALVIGGALVLFHRPLLVAYIKAAHGDRYPWLRGKSYDSTAPPWEWVRGWTPQRYAEATLSDLFTLATNPASRYGPARPPGSWKVSEDQQP